MDSTAKPAMGLPSFSDAQLTTSLPGDYILVMLRYGLGLSQSVTAERGKAIVKVLPWPGWLVTWISDGDDRIEVVVLQLPADLAAAFLLN